MIGKGVEFPLQEFQAQAEVRNPNFSELSTRI
jgi:hypothetical protein